MAAPPSAASDSGPGSSAAIQLHRLGVVDSYDPSPAPGSASLSASCTFRANVTIFVDPPSNAAFFRVEAALALRVPSTHANNHSVVGDASQLKVSLHIHPDQITSLAFSRLPKLPGRLGPVYHHLSNKETFSLQLILRSPPTLVVPNIGALVPITRSDINLIAAFQRIAGAASPALALYIAGTALTDAQASSLCATVPSMSRTVNPRYTDLRTFCGGLGAREVALDEVADVMVRGSPTASASPPAYDEADHKPPDYRHEVRKRPRQRSLGSKNTADIESGSVEGATLAELQKQAQVLQQLLREVRSTTSRLQALNAEADAKEERLREKLSDADAKLNQLAEATADYEYEASEGLGAYIDNRMDEMRSELLDHLDERFEQLEADTIMRAEMEEYVEEQVCAAKSDLREALAGGGVRILLPEE